jgi:hypothetical protein
VSTLAGDFWVCGDCRSINNAGAEQCYNCRTPREVAALDPEQIDAPLPVAAPATPVSPTTDLPAFRSSRGVAVLASVLILAFAVMQVFQTVTTTNLYIAVLGGTAATVEESRYVANLVILTLGVAALALIGWSLWLSRTVTSMPALGLGLPAVTGLMAFFENFIPVLNLVLVPAIVRDVVLRLEARASRIHVLGFAAWVGLWAGFVIPRISRAILDRGGTPSDAAIRSQLLLDALGTIVVLLSAIFLVALIWWVEDRVQRRRTMQINETGSGGRAVLAASSVRRMTEPDIVQRRPVFAATGATWAAEAAVPMGHSPELVGVAAPATVAPVSPEPFAAAAVAAPATVDQVYRAPEATPAPAEVLPTEVVPAETVPEATVAAETTAAESTPAASQDRPPHLTIRIASGGMMTIELDGQTEHVILDDLTAYASALTEAGGSAEIVAPPDDGMADLIARRAKRILEEAGVTLASE